MKGSALSSPYSLHFLNSPRLLAHTVGHPENIVLVEGGIASLSPTELQRYSVDRDDVTGIGDLDIRCV